MHRPHIFQSLGIAASLVFASTMVLQYPLQTSFPIGGDVTRTIRRAQEVASAGQDSLIKGFTTLLTNSRYPGTTAILAASGMLPGGWPERFTWLITLGHIATAISCGWILYRIAGWQSAAIGTALWSLATISLTGHTEDGTLAQLWSLPLVILFLNQQAKGSVSGVLFTIFAAFLLHPMSGAIALLTALTVQTAYVIGFRKQAPDTVVWTRSLVLLALAIGTALLFILTTQDISVLFTDLSEDRAFDLVNALRSPFGPFLLLAPVGIMYLIRKIYKQPAASLSILVFSVLSTLLTFNNLFGASVLTFRFQSYFIVAAVLLAAIALPTITRLVFRQPFLRTAFIITLFAVSGLATWNDNARVFSYYEEPAHYARLHPDERAAISWLAEHAPPGSTVVSTNANRHSEWIPILTEHNWVGLPADNTLWHLPEEELRGHIATASYTYAVLFKHREDPKDQFATGTDIFPIVFQNDGAVIIQLANQ